MKQDTLILLGGMAALAVVGYLVLGRQKGLSTQDVQKIETEAADDSSAIMMAQIVSMMKDMNKNVPQYDPWDDPNTYAKFAEMGIQLASTIIGAAV